jgi:hypothetical protein
LHFKNNIMTISIILIVALLLLYIQYKVSEKRLKLLNDEKTSMTNENKRLKSIILSLKDDEYIKTISKQR